MSDSNYDRDVIFYRLMVHALSVSTLEDVGYRVLFQDGQVLLYSEGVTLDANVVLGIK